MKILTCKGKKFYRLPKNNFDIYELYSLFIFKMKKCNKVLTYIGNNHNGDFKIS